MIWLKPYTELGTVVAALDQYGPEAQGHPAYQTAYDVWAQFPPIQVHPSLRVSDIMAFFPMLHELEEHVGVPFPDDELWFVHEVVEWYSLHIRPQCWITKGTLDKVMLGVANLDAPPY